jgi:hypothetical protein
MLRMKNTNDDMEEFFATMDDEFETLEDIILNALEIIDKYDRQIEQSKQLWTK